MISNWTANQGCKKSHMLAKQWELLTNYYQGPVRRRVWEIFFSTKTDFLVPTPAVQYCVWNPGWPSRSFARFPDPKHHGCQKSTSWWTEHEGVSFMTAPVARKLWNEIRLALMRRRHGPEGKHFIAAESYSPTWVDIRPGACCTAGTNSDRFTGFRLL